MTKPIVTGRRAVIAGALATPFIWRPARAAQQLVIRTTGGVYDDIMRRSVYDGFTKATGIEVVTAAATMSKLIAMYKAGGAEFDIIDTGDSGLLNLERLGALLPIDYASWKYGNPDEIIKELKFPYRVGSYVYATVSTYNKQAFPDKHPSNWAEFWDIKAFPGPRSLPDMGSGQPPLELALIADGVAPDKLYPIDLDRAFKSLTRIRPAVPKFWDTGALSAQMLSDKEVVLSAVWNGRVQTLIDKGAPLAIEWNQNMIQVQAYGVPKLSSNPKGAQLFVDYASQASAQVGYAKELRYGPSNTKAYAMLPQDLLDIMPGGPKYRDLGFYQKIDWWEDNRDRVTKAWSNWVLG
ncbi:ABC transporter substrate-binding protein [Acidisphaera sp. L21]|uniref:ABC transporter substrate-binding protein n=1 Tax=Acidisphaera sp. L21 TaxID=1641851 RepID=UPI00131DF667|nr:ABC transporter substrate-binding protein [Acidisphaera sp. L21]